MVYIFFKLFCIFNYKNNFINNNSSTPVESLNLNNLMEYYAGLKA